MSYLSILLIFCYVSAICLIIVPQVAYWVQHRRRVYKSLEDLKNYKKWRSGSQTWVFDGTVLFDDGFVMNHGKDWAVFRNKKLQSKFKEEIDKLPMANYYELDEFLKKNDV